MRRLHRKVRTGCSECRRRRVKCDEKRPECANCARNKLQCSLIFLTPAIRGNEGRPRIPMRRSSQVSTKSPGPSTGLEYSTLDPLSRELFNHYVTTVCYTLSSKYGRRLQNDIQRLCLSHEFLLHGVLSITALHLSRLIPSRSTELVPRAMREQSKCLPMYQTLIREKNSSTFHAVFAFSGTVVPYILAINADNNCQTRLPTRHDIRPHWFLAVRGLVALTLNNWQLLKQGPFSPVIVMRAKLLDYSRNPADHILADLFELFTPTPVPQAPIPRSTLSNADKHVCLHALEELRRAFSLPYSRLRSWLDGVAAVVIWAGSILPEFVELIYDRVPEALVLLAYYCVLLKRVNACWYYSGLGEGLLRTIQEELGDEWEPWIRWAVEEPASELNLTETIMADWEYGGSTSEYEPSSEYELSSEVASPLKVHELCYKA